MTNRYVDVLKLLDNIAVHKSTTTKKLIITSAWSDPYFKAVLTLALDPYRTFGVRDFDKPAVHTDTVLSLDVFQISMGALERREVSGGAAKRMLAELEARGVPHELLQRIIRKDLRCGIGAELVNKVQPKFIPTFKVALAEEYVPVEFPIYVSPKFDGLRCIVLIDDENVQLVSRNGNAFPALDDYKQAWLDLGVRNVMFDCEVIAGDFFQSLGVKKKKAKAGNATFHTFDMMTLAEFNSQSCAKEQWQRLDELSEIIKPTRSTDNPIQYVPHAFLATNELVMEHYEHCRGLGLEGLIIKKKNARYAFRRSSDWTKLKDVKTFDLPVKKLIEGQGQFVGTCGALVVDFHGVEVRVGTGLSVKHKTDPTKNRDWFWQKKAEIEEAWDNGTPMIVEVSAHEVTPDKSLRHPRLERVRTDKTLADGPGV